MNPSKIMDYLSYRGDLHAYYHILNASCGLFTEDFGGWHSFSFYLRFLQDCLSDVPNEILFCSIDLVLSSRHPFAWKFSDIDVRNSLLVIYQVVYVTRSVEELATVQRRRKETV